MPLLVLRHVPEAKSGSCIYGRGSFCDIHIYIIHIHTGQSSDVRIVAKGSFFCVKFG